MLPLMLGTAQLGLDYGVTNKKGRLSQRVVVDILSQAASAGLDAIDTAALYNESEARLGEVGKHIDLGCFRLQTKTPVFSDLSEEIQHALGEILKDFSPEVDSFSVEKFAWAGGQIAPVPQGWRAGFFFLNLLQNRSLSELEKTLKQVLVAYPKQEEKIRALVDKGVGRLTERFEHSLNLLQAPIHSLLFHQGLDLLTPFLGPALWKAATKMKEKGLVQRVGVSLYRPQTLAALLKTEIYSLEVLQFPMSALDQRFLQGDIVNKLQQQGVWLQARSLFLQGLLLAAPRSNIVGLDSLSPFLDAFHQHCRQENLLATVFALGPLLAVKDISGVFGVDTMEQWESLKESADAVSGLALKSSFESLACPFENLLLPPCWS